MSNPIERLHHDIHRLHVAQHHRASDARELKKDTKAGKQEHRRLNHNRDAFDTNSKELKKDRAALGKVKDAEKAALDPLQQQRDQLQAAYDASIDPTTGQGDPELASQLAVVNEQIASTRANFDPKVQAKQTEVDGEQKKADHLRDAIHGNVDEIHKLRKEIKHDRNALKHDQNQVKRDRKIALKHLEPAEYKMGLKATNRARHELGLKRVDHVIRPESQKLSKAVKIALEAAHLEARSHCYDYTQAYGARTNYGRSPTSRGGNGRITFDCSGFVGAVYKAAGLPPPYTVGYTGTSFDVAGCKNMKKVSQSQARPGDVVVFPDHIALYIGHGKCVSMGQEGDPRVVSVAAEAAYQNRGIQGFYHPRGA